MFFLIPKNCRWKPLKFILTSEHLGQVCTHQINVYEITIDIHLSSPWTSGGEVAVVAEEDISLSLSSLYSLTNYLTYGNTSLYHRWN